MRFQLNVFALLLLGALHLSGSLPTAARPVKAATDFGPQHHLTRCANGDVWAWGLNASGQLGYDPASLPDQRRPRPVAGLTDVAATAVSTETSFALLSTGKVFCWGGNSRGELGVGYPSSPIWLFIQAGNLSNIVSIAAGDYHAVALRDDGTVWTWGANDQGQLGNGTTTDSPDPVAVLDQATNRPLSGIVSIASAANHTLALTASGQLYSWGSNGSGELGTGSTARFATRAGVVAVWGVGTMALGAAHCLVIDIRGQVYTWGNNTYGQLGDGSGVNQSLPVTVRGLPGQVGVRGVACTRFTSLLTLYGVGDTYVWGNNSNGEFGVCTPARATLPVRGFQFSGKPVITGEGTMMRALDESGNTLTWGGPAYIGYQPQPPYQTVTGGSCQPTFLDLCTGAPTQPTTCVQSVQQLSGATYAAANHLGSTALPTDIGAYGVTTTIDARLFGYGGAVVFNGQYRVRGTVRLINGTFELRPGTVFYVDGRSGQTLSGSQSQDNEYNTSTFLQVEDATLLLRGARMQAACDRAWGGIQLQRNGRIRTQLDPATSQRCKLRDAFIAVDCYGPLQNGVLTATSSEYYLNHTDFENNLQGVFDWYKGVALADEGVHYCSFSSDYPNVKFPFTQSIYHPHGTGGVQRLQPAFTGIQFFSLDDTNGNQGADYAAARVNHNTFHHLVTGIIGSARNLRVNDNSFDYIRYGIDNPNRSFRSIPMYLENNTITLRGSDPYFAGLLGIGGNVFMRGNRITGSDANPAAHPQVMVGIEVNEIDGSAQTGNMLERLNVGISVLLSPYNPWGVADISGNLFRDCYQGMRFGSSSYNGFHTTGTLRLRCNTFQNPARLPGSVGLYITSGTSQFPDKLGDIGDANGNKFGVNGVLEPNFTPIENNSIVRFWYYRYSSSGQELVTQPITQTFRVSSQGGSPAYACTAYVNGINARPSNNGEALVSQEGLQAAQDSLLLPSLSPAQRDMLLNTVTTGFRQHNGIKSAEQYINALPDQAGYIHGTLTGWLMNTYRRNGQEADARRISGLLQQNHASDPDIVSYAQLFEAQGEINSIYYGSPMPAAVLVKLRAVAASATSAAWAACRLLQRYEPNCDCRLTNKKVLSLAKLSSGVVATTLSVPYPNPTSEQVRVAYQLATSGSARLELRDLLGRVVYQMALVGQGNREVEVSVRGLANGLYLLALVVDSKTLATQRVVVQP